jgi:AmiR/NasT family two-component response regulator
MRIASTSSPESRSSLRIVVADADPSALAFYREALGDVGHELCFARSGPHLVEQCRLLRPDLVIVGVRLDGMDGIAAADEICRERRTAVLLVSDFCEPLWVARALVNDCILAFLPKPLDGAALGAAAAVAVRRFEWMESLRAEADSARRALEDRQLIERAKGAVMRYVGVDEQEAYARLRRMSSNSNKKPCDAARDVLASAEVFGELANCDTGTAGHTNESQPASFSRRPRVRRV